MDVLLVLAAAAAAGLVIGVIGALPWIWAMAAGGAAPDLALRRPQVAGVAGGLFLGIVVCLAAAMDASQPGGMLVQREVLEQLLPIGVAVVLGGCLIVVAWQPAWVAAELRRLAVALPPVTAAVLLISGTADGRGFMALVSTTMAAALLAAAALRGLSRLAHSAAGTQAWEPAKDRPRARALAA